MSSRAIACGTLFLPREAGEGDRLKGGGGGARHLLVTLAPQFRVKNAPTTMLRMVPLPRFAIAARGRMSALHAIDLT
jgi:hypothetical protein